MFLFRRGKIQIQRAPVLPVPTVPINDGRRVRVAGPSDGGFGPARRQGLVPVRHRGSHNSIDVADVARRRQLLVLEWQQGTSVEDVQIQPE